MNQVTTPAPGASAVVAPMDPTTALASAALAIGDLDAGSARARAVTLATKRDTALKQAHEALAQAAKAREDGGFFSKWGSTLQGVALVASATATVASCGAGTPLLVSVLAISAAGCSVGSYAMKETGADGKLCKLKIGGTEFQLNWSDAVALAGLAAGGASLFVSAPQAGAKATEHGAQTARVAEQGTRSWANEACRVLVPVSLGVAAGATAGRAYFTVRAGEAQADAVEHDADAADAKHECGEVKSKTEDVVDQLQNVRQVQSKIVEIASSLVEEQSQTLNAVLSRRA